MLSFYYDFLLKFVGNKSFEMTEMNTDSCYFGVAAKSLRGAIKPEMLSLFEQNILVIVEMISQEMISIMFGFLVNAVKNTTNTTSERLV